MITNTSVIKMKLALPFSQSTQFIISEENTSTQNLLMQVLMRERNYLLSASSSSEACFLDPESSS